MESNHKMNEAQVKNARHLSVKKSVRHRFFTVNDVYSHVSRQVNDATEQIPLLLPAMRPLATLKDRRVLFLPSEVHLPIQRQTYSPGQNRELLWVCCPGLLIEKVCCWCIDESRRNWCMPHHSERRPLTEDFLEHSFNFLIHQNSLPHFFHLLEAFVKVN